MSDNAFPDALPSQYRLHWYVIDRVLGQGGFGITYLARDTNLDQPVAIKEYLPVEVATRRPDATVAARTEEQQERYRWGLERFIREARTLARFDHPNIVRVLSVFELNSTAYMVMRFEEGETLAAMLERRQALSEADLLRVLLPILDGLELVHNAGFIHRDIKPDNIHIRNDGTPVLLDFGSARYAVGQMRTVTILVAPGYAPFEQYYSTGENQGPWTDIYGLGATCYRAIAGRAPLDAIARSKGILGSTQELLVPATAVGSGRYSERLLKAVDHALAFTEKERPQTIAEWRRELGNGASADATRTRSSVLAAEIRKPALEAEVEPTKRSVSFRITMAWSLLAVVFAAAAIGALIWFGPGKPQQMAQAQSPSVPNDTEARLRDREQKLADEEKKLKELIARQQEERRLELQKAEERRNQEAQNAEQRRAEAPKKERSRPDAKAPAQAKATPEPVAKTQPIPIPPPAAEPKPQSVPETVAKAEPPPPPAPKPPSVRDQLVAAEAATDRGDYAEAVRLLRPLADQGNARAQVRLADLYLDGRGVPQSDKEALSLYVKAAKNGDTEAQFRAGDMYSQGKGAPANMMLAYAFYGAAAKAGLAAGKLHQERVGKLLQPAEIEQADRLSQDFIRRRDK